MDCSSDFQNRSVNLEDLLGWVTVTMKMLTSSLATEPMIKTLLAWSLGYTRLSGVEERKLWGSDVDNDLVRSLEIASTYREFSFLC